MPAPARAVGVSFSARRRRRRWWPRRWGCRCRTRHWRRRGNRSGWTWPGARPGRWWNCRQRGSRRGRISPRVAAQRDGGPRGVRRLDEPAAARACDCAARACAADRRGLDRHNRTVPRLVDALPNGPVGHPTVRVFLAGGVPEVMLHLRELGLLDEKCLTVTRRDAGPFLDWWETSERAAAVARAAACTGRHRPGRCDHESRAGAGARPDHDRDVSARQSRPGGLGHQEHGDRCRAWWTPTASTARPGPARVFTTEKAAIAAIKGQGATKVRPGDCSC